MSDPERIDVTVVRRVAFAPWWSPISRFFEGVVRTIPAHRDSRVGRRNAAQIRAAFLVVGIAIVVLWDSPWAVTGFAFLALALVIPMSESRRRGLIASARAARAGHTREERTPGILELTDKHITLLHHDQRLRRLLRRNLDVTRTPTTVELRAGAKKIERLVITTTSPDDSSLELWVHTKSFELGQW